MSREKSRRPYTAGNGTKNGKPDPGQFAGKIDNLLFFEPVQQNDRGLLTDSIEYPDATNRDVANLLVEDGDQESHDSDQVSRDSNQTSRDSDQVSRDSDQVSRDRLIRSIGSKYINPLTDYGFKRIFGREENKELLIDFLNHLLADETGGQIVDLHYLDGENTQNHPDSDPQDKQRPGRILDHQNTEQIPTLVSDRKAIFDLYCIGRDGEHFIVELQNQKQKHFLDRMLYYLTYPIQNMAAIVKKKAAKYPGKSTEFALSPVYCIALLNFLLQPGTGLEAGGQSATPGTDLEAGRKSATLGTDFEADQRRPEPQKSFKTDRRDKPPQAVFGHRDSGYRHDIQLVESQSGEIFYDKLRLILIELPKFRKRPDLLRDGLEKWLYVLVHLPGMKELPQSFDEPVFRKLFETAEISNMEYKELISYVRSWKAHHDYHAGLSYAREEGLEQGLEQGLKQGREEGREEGRDESLAAVAIKMLKNGMETDLIARYTGLSLEQIELIRKEQGIL